MASPDHPSSPVESPTAPPQDAGTALAVHAVNAMAAKKAKEITVIDLREVSSMANFFVIGTGESDLQVRAIANGVVERIEEARDEQPWKKEGMDHLRWVVLDYVHLVAHVFLPSRRDHYRIERLWGEADSETISAQEDASDVALLQELLRSPDNE